MSNIRADKIDDAVCQVSELVAALSEAGPLTPKQIDLLITAAARAAVANAQGWEIRQSVTRVMTDLERGGSNEKVGA